VELIVVDFDYGDDSADVVDELFVSVVKVRQVFKRDPFLKLSSSAMRFVSLTHTQSSLY